MKIAVVILNWNGAALLQQFLPSVIDYSAGADIYVADNASTDDSISILESEFPSVKIIKNDQNYGFANGYNEALKFVAADILALVNSDIEVTPNWLQSILQTFEDEPETAIIQPKILDFKNKDYFEYAGAAGGFIDKFGFPFCRGRIFDSLEKDLGQYDNNPEIFWASGACFFIRNSVYQKLNGFDGDFFAHQEEIDLCWRAFNNGYKIKYVHESKVFHVGGATLEHGNPQKTFLNFRNSLFMLLKNLPKNQLFPTIFIRMVLDGIAGLQFLSKGKLKHFLAVIRAHFAFYGNFSKFYSKRGSKQSASYYKTDSIVYSHFIKGIKSFKNLF